VDLLDSVSKKYNLMINIDKTKVMSTDGTTCNIHISDKILEQVDTFPCIGSLITADAECTKEIRSRWHNVLQNWHCGEAQKDLAESRHIQVNQKFGF